MVEKPIFKAWPPSHGIHGCPMTRGRTLARTSILHFPFDLLVNHIQKNKIKPVILQRACVCVCVSVCLSLHAHTNHVEAMAVSDNWDHIHIYISTKNKRIWERERERERENRTQKDKIIIYTTRPLVAETYACSSDSITLTNEYAPSMFFFSSWQAIFKNWCLASWLIRWFMNCQNKLHVIYLGLDTCR